MVAKSIGTHRGFGVVDELAAVPSIQIIACFELIIDRNTLIESIDVHWNFMIYLINTVSEFAIIDKTQLNKKDKDC